MRQSMHEHKHRRRDRHDDVLNVGTSRDASRRNKSRGEPISIPSNKDEHKSSRIARMQTSKESRQPERKSKVTTTTTTEKHVRLKQRIDPDEEAIQIESDEELKLNKPKRRRLIKHTREEDDDDDVYRPPLEKSSVSSFIKPPQPRRRTLHSPLSSYTNRELRVPTLGESVKKASEFHRLHSIFDDDEEYKPVDDETKKAASPVILPWDPIDDEEIQCVGSDEHVLTYPFKAKKSVTVYERDFERLEEETYVNDTLVDVYPKIWADEFPHASIYTFSSFFFTKLWGSHNTMHYDTVKRWTNNVDIFTKKFVIIPIAQHNHWFLIVVANPGYCIQGQKGEQYHPDVVVENLSDDIEEPKSIRKTRKKVKTAGTPLDKNKPYIILLDPLHLNKPGAAKMVIRYLKEEAMTKLEIESSEFMTPEIVMPACPGQDNFTDCGIFCLHYMKSLYQYTDDMMTTLYNNRTHDDTWDKDHTLPGFRTHLKRILKKKMKEYRDYLSVQK